MPEETNGERVSRGVHSLNPFSKRDEFSRNNVLGLQIATLITYIIFLVNTIYYDANSPSEGHYHKHSIWGQNSHHGHSPFAQSSIITSIYWLILLLLQIVYIYFLASNNTTYVTAAANVGAHFIASNLLLFGFVHLWTRSHFVLAELLIIINFFNLSFAYFRHSTTPRLIHIGVVSGPLAWNFVALYWVGAVMVHAHGLAARIVANIFIWGILAYGLFFLAAYKDYTIGFALSVLAFSTGLGNFRSGVVQLQWIFAFTIGGLLFILSLAVGIPGLLGRDPFPRGQIVSEDRERAPLLADE
ncbi:hypothetical protein BDV96DRAFT_119077 [Lophiotrema nucula]|uniref:DUF1774-domain-containing protein n=1 Tax=Lophiotrema nucula TaxID=690887 RepID=A0A6A5Z2S1_9PLEO|nr:hypothetical protein BDV96DRAFT_119077 [Lophiotrema nucula]